MATIKSYTDLSQSKVLSEILPLESADMEYMFLKKDGSKVSNVPFVKDGFEEPECCYTFIPCWSLAALLNVLPDELEDNHFLTLEKEGKEYCCCYEDANGNSFRHCFSDNPIDACVAMIEKLYKLKIL